MAVAVAVARIDGRSAQTDRKLDGLTRMVARSPSGVTLINLVQQIFNKVQKLD